MEYDKTFLGIDFGERRIGIAKSDPTGLIASALKTLEVSSMKDSIKQIKDVIDEYEPNGIVVGYPLLPSGDRSKKCDVIDLFIDQLKAVFDGPIHKEDEIYSSGEAEKVIHAHGKRIGKDKKRIDRLAAVIILQRFLDESLEK